MFQYIVVLVAMIKAPWHSA